MNGDWLGLIISALVLVGMGLLCCLRVYRYNPDGDRCEHGKRMPDEFCMVCGGTIEVNSDDELNGQTVGLAAFRAPDEELRRG